MQCCICAHSLLTLRALSLQLFCLLTAIISNKPSDNLLGCSGFLVWWGRTGHLTQVNLCPAKNGFRFFSVYLPQCGKAAALCMTLQLHKHQPAWLCSRISCELEYIASAVSTSSSFRSFGCIVLRDRLRPSKDDSILVLSSDNAHACTLMDVWHSVAHRSTHV